jgi:hypothetical protein
LKKPIPLVQFPTFADARENKSFLSLEPFGLRCAKLLPEARFSHSSDKKIRNGRQGANPSHFQGSAMPLSHQE